MDLRGYGGHEKPIAEFFHHRIESGRLHDAIDENGQRFEYKKGALAWLDLRKWIDLSAEDAHIIIRFIKFEPQNGQYVEHRDITYRRMLSFLPQDLIDASRPFVGTKTQLKYPFKPFCAESNG